MTLMSGLLARRRRRSLASDARAGSWARGRARTAQREFLLETWWLFGAFIAIALVAAVVCGWFIPSAFMRGLVVGVAMVAAPGAVWIFAMQYTNTAPVMMGDQAEQWTAQELRHSTRRGWRLVNHFALRADDIDHVLVGPGGAYAVETKWSGSPWHSDYGLARLERAVAQAKENARVLRLWHPYMSQRVPVSAVVVLWGRGLSKWSPEDQVRVIDNVHVVAGRALRVWLEQNDSAVLTATQVESLWEAMETQVSRRDPIEAKEYPLPMSVAEWAARSIAAVTCACLALIVFAWILQWTGHWLAAALLSLPLIFPAVLACRKASSRLLIWSGWAWASTMALLDLAFAFAAVADRL